MNALTRYTGNYPITTHYKNGARFTVYRTPRGYVLSGVLFASLSAAMHAAEAGRPPQAAAGGGRQPQAAASNI